MPRNKNLAIGDVWIAKRPDMPGIIYEFQLVAFAYYHAPRRGRSRRGWSEKKAWLACKLLFPPMGDQTDNGFACYWFNENGQCITNDCEPFKLTRKSRSRHLQRLCTGRK